MSINPELQEQKDAKPASGRFQIISKEDLIASKRATGRDIDKEDARLLELNRDSEPGNPQSEK